MEIILLLLILLFALITQIIIHEIGHIVLGLMTGYKFISINILGILFYKNENGKLIIKFSQKGISGQGLLSPGFVESVNIPYFWYNAGGILFNLISSIICGSIAMIFKQDSLIYTVLIFTAIIGLFLSIFGSIPISSASVSYDAYNIMMLRKNHNSKYSFWRILKIEEVLNAGKSYCDCPKEWFAPLSEPDYKNSLTCGWTLYKIYWFMECGNFAESESLCRDIIAEKRARQSYRDIAICEREFCRIFMNENNENKAAEDIIFSIQDQNSKDRCDTFTNRHILYAQAKLVLKDEQKAEALKKDLEKNWHSNNRNGEIKFERKLFSFIDLYSLNFIKER